jgi:sRNA-binding carbon storage regulator CsrA
MKRFDDTIGYAIKFGEEIEIRILDISGEQRRVSVGASNELFANPQKICERIDAEKVSQAA